MDKTTCAVCSQRFLSINKLLTHVLIHGLMPEQYYVQCDFGGTHPTCKCGCGQQTTFFKNTRTFGKYLRGHVSRIRNNWSHEEVFQKSIETRRKMWASGELSSWNKGLTKKTDTRVAEIGYKGSKTVKNDPTKVQKRSENMRRCRLSGVIPTLFGSNHPRWRGGTASLSGECHGDGRLYRKWKFPKLQTAGFKCMRCGLNDGLCVHHDGERMAFIIRRFMHEYGYDGSIINHELKRKVIDAVVQYHIDNSVSGVALCFRCHEKEHVYLNYRVKQ